MKTLSIPRNRIVSVRRLCSVFTALAVILTALGVWQFAPLKVSAAGTDYPVDITGAANVTEVNSRINAEIAKATTIGDTVTVSGTFSTANTSLTINIPAGVTVIWEAEYTGSVGLGDLIKLTDSGAFNMTGGKIENTTTMYSNTIRNVSTGKITISGTAEVTTAGGAAIYNEGTGNITVNGGTVTGKDHGIDMKNNAVLFVESGTITAHVGIRNQNNSVTVISGGTVKGTGSYAALLDNNSSLYLWGAASFDGIISRTSPTATPTAYYIGDYFDKFNTNTSDSAPFTPAPAPGADLFDLAAVTVTANGSAHIGATPTEHDVVATLSDKLDLTDGATTVNASAGSPTVNTTVNTVTFSQNGNINPTITVTGAKIAGTNIAVPNFTTATFGVNIDKPAPTNASISPTTANFDKYTSATDYKDIAVTLTPESYTLSAITDGTATLAENTHYTKSGNTYTFKKEYLATLGTGTQTLTFEMSGGTNPTLTVTVSDTTPAPVCSHVWVSNGNGTHKCTQTVNPCGTTSETCSQNSAGDTCSKCGYKTPTGGGNNGGGGNGGNGGNGGGNQSGGATSTTPKPAQPSGKFSNNTYVLGSGIDLVFIVDNKELKQLNSISVDGKTRTKNTDYKAESGSVIITIYASYLDKLDMGEHKLTVRFSDNTSITAAFYITEDVSSGAGIEGEFDILDFSKNAPAAIVQILIIAVVVSGSTLIIVTVRQKKRYKIVKK